MTTLIHDPKFLHHFTGNSPESPERYQSILSVLESDKNLWTSLIHKLPYPADINDILRCHTAELVEQVKTICENGGGAIDADTIVSVESFDIALLAAGAAMLAVDEVLSGTEKNAFSLARPPGHHATRNQAMGFCLFNNAAIAARYAQEKYQVKNILIVDWDVHHGNGTQDIFYSDPDVFYFSIHEYPFYPGTGAFAERGEGPGKDRTLNIPLPAGTTAEVHRKAFHAALVAIKKIFTPDLIIISAGFDARQGDPLAQMQLQPQDYFSMTEEVMDFANECCDGKIISVLEGGYVDSHNSLGEAVRQHVLALNGDITHALDRKQT